MTTTGDQGRRLEQAIAACFAAHGYATRCNQVREGRSGGRHEIDVLAEMSDPLTTYRVAVECKAWQQPIEKDVVSKLHYVLTDLGLSKGIVVSQGGCRSGAAQAATALGIDLWGPDELRRYLGEAAAGALTVPPAATSQTLTLGLPVTVPPEAARRTIEASGKGRFNLRTLEQLVWTSQVWLPVHAVWLNVAQPEVRLLKTRLRSTTVGNLYEALGGGYLGRVGPLVEVRTDQRATLQSTVRDTKVHGTLRKAVDGYLKVTSETAKERHAATLASLGIPTPCASLTVDDTRLVHLPYYTGLLQADGRERVAAVAAWTGELSEAVSRTLTTNLTHLRSHFAPR